MVNGGVVKSAQEPAAGSVLFSFLALLVAAAGTAGSIWLSVGLGLKACPLCFYQRSMVMAAAGVLLIGLLLTSRRGVALCVLALPLAVCGLGVASFHVFLELSGKLECPTGLLDIGTAPQQSAAMFALLVVVLLAGAVRPEAGAAPGLINLIAGLGLGGAGAYGAILSAPPLPPVPQQPYTTPLDMCRPPYDARTTEATEAVPPASDPTTGPSSATEPTPDAAPPVTPAPPVSEPVTDPAKGDETAKASTPVPAPTEEEKK